MKRIAWKLFFLSAAGLYLATRTPTEPPTSHPPIVDWTKAPERLDGEAVEAALPGVGDVITPLESDGAPRLVAYGEDPSTAGGAGLASRTPALLSSASPVTPLDLRDPSALVMGPGASRYLGPRAVVE